MVDLRVCSTVEVINHRTAISFAATFRQRVGIIGNRARSCLGTRDS